MNSFVNDIDNLYEGIFQKLMASDFGKNLGGELPLYIQPIPVSMQSEINSKTKALIARLSKKGKTAIAIDLFQLCLEVLDEEGILQTLLEEEKELDHQDISATLDSILDIKEVVIPRIRVKIEQESPDYVFITGVGNVYPFLRSHGILNNIDELTKDSKLILFFPGDYNNLQLSLFGSISDENYYRGQNLNEIKCTYENI